MVKKLKGALCGALALAVGLVAYSQEKSSRQEVGSEQSLTYEVIVKATDNARITGIVVKEGDNEEVVINYNETSWNRSFSGDLPVSINIKGEARQSNDSSAKMTVEVFKEGELYRNGVAEGAHLALNVSF